jgi:hypothetical protein
MQPPEILAIWRSELAAELVAARSARDAAEAEVVAAAAAASVAQAERAALDAAVSRLPREPRMAGALSVKVHGRRDDLALAAGRLSRARMELKNAELLLADTAAALDQVSLIAPAEEAEAA